MSTVLEWTMKLSSFLDIVYFVIITNIDHTWIEYNLTVARQWGGFTGINLKLRLILVSPCNPHWLIWRSFFFQSLKATDWCLIFCFVVCLLGKILIQKGGYQEEKNYACLIFKTSSGWTSKLVLLWYKKESFKGPEKHEFNSKECFSPEDLLCLEQLLRYFQDSDILCNLTSIYRIDHYAVNACKLLQYGSCSSITV